LVKQYEKDLTHEQKEQFEVYKSELLTQIRLKRDALEAERDLAKMDITNYPGLKLGEYNPNFKNLLKAELERQISEKRSKEEQEKSKKLIDEKERVRKATEATRNAEQESQNYQVSMKRRLKDMVRGNFEKATAGKNRQSGVKLIDQDYVPELDFAAPGIGIGHIHDAEIDTPTRMKQYHTTHNVNRKADAEDDYWFVKRLNENEHQIMYTEEKNKRNMRNTMEKMMHDEVNRHPSKVIVGSKLRHKH
jgi:hypothetical protein